MDQQITFNTLPLKSKKKSNFQQVPRFLKQRQYMKYLLVESDSQICAVDQLQIILTFEGMELDDLHKPV